MVKPKQSNCILEIETFGLSVLTKGGARFNIPLEEPIQALYPMSEGILIQFIIKQELKFSEILYLQRNKNIINEAETNNDTKYSYVTINRHPLNPLKFLNMLKNDKI